MDLNKDERIDDLEINNFKIIQNKNGFCFGMDSVLLSDFAKDIKKDVKVIDLGTGTGIIPILLCAKTDAKEIVGVELQEEVCTMAKKSILLNKLENKIKIIKKDIKELNLVFNKGTFDVVTTNPPYKKKNTGLKNENKNKIISRHETTAELEDFIKISKDLLKDKGEFYMVHRPERLTEIISLMRKYKIEPKKLRFVCPNYKKEPNLILIKGIKNANPFLKVEKNIYVYNEDGSYTEEVLKIYNKK